MLQSDMQLFEVNIMNWCGINMILIYKQLMLISDNYDLNVPPPIAEIRQVAAVDPAVVAGRSQPCCLLVSGVLWAPHKRAWLQLRDPQYGRTFHNDILAMHEHLQHRRALRHASPMWALIEPPAQLQASPPLLCATEIWA